MMFHAMFWHLRSSKLPIAVKNHHFVCFFNKKSILFPQQTVKLPDVSHTSPTIT